MGEPLFRGIDEHDPEVKAAHARAAATINKFRELVQNYGGGQFMATGKVIEQLRRHLAKNEVDAALDEENARRFVGLLKGYCDDTQFLLITHNRRTMTQADVVWGVTMAEQGVSKPFAMRLDDHVRQPEQPTPRQVA